MKFESQIYYPDKDRVNISKSQKYYYGGIILFIIFCLLAIINQDSWNSDSLDILFKTCCFITLGIFSYGKFSSIKSREKLNGKLEGKIAITSDFIEIDDKKYEINKVENLKIQIKDYNGKYRNPGLYYVGPWYMAGINNKLKFEYRNQVFEINFRINSEEEFEILKKINADLSQRTIYKPLYESTN